MTTKVCTLCKRELDISCFYPDKSKKDGYGTRCKECTNKVQNEQRQKLKAERERLGQPKPATKICIECKRELPASDFSIDSKTVDGLSIRCRECKKIIDTRNREARKAAQKIIPKSKVCSVCGIDKLITDFDLDSGSLTGHASECKECRKKRTAKYRKEVLEPSAERLRIKKEADRRYREKLKSDPEYKMQNINTAIAEGIRYSLKKGRNIDSPLGKTWEMMVGSYNQQTLVSHLEKQFIEGMTWDNYGTFWSIDHIVPKSFFQFTTVMDKDFKIYWSLLNLRPLPVEQMDRRPDDGSDISEQIRNRILSQEV